MTGVSFTILIAMAPAPPEIVNAVREIHVETTTSGASVFRMVLGNGLRLILTGLACGLVPRIDTVAQTLARP